MRDINELRFIWKPPRVFDYQMIMSRVAERSDGNCFDEYFRKLDDYRNAENRFLLGFGDGGETGVATGAHLEDSHVGQMIGHNVNINNLHLAGPSREVGASEQERKSILTDKFAAGLRLVTVDDPLVIFFDAFEKASDDTRDWVWNYLFEAVAEDRVGKVTFVIFTEEVPQLDEEVTDIVDVIELQPLEATHIAEYMKHKGVQMAEEALAEFASRLTATQGEMQDIANAVDAYLQTQSRVSSLVIFFDAFEKASDDTRDWVWNYLFEAVAEDRVGKVTFVIFTEEVPQLDEEVTDIVDVIELQPLEATHIAEYMKHKGVQMAEEALAEFASRLTATQGEMQDIANAVDAYLQTQGGIGASG